MSEKRVSSWSGHSSTELRERWGRQDVHLYGAVSSTNEVARHRAEQEDAPSGTIVLAREQTAGRGRGDRTWHSPPGGLYMSMVFRPGRVENPAILPVLAGLGVVRELDRAWPELGAGLKWPNDLLSGDAKLGGVLSEGAWDEQEGLRFLVVGVGVNVRPVADGLPEELRVRAVSMDEVLDGETPLVEVADAVVDGLEAYLPDAPPRMDPRTLDLVDRFDRLRDRRVEVKLPGEEEALPGACVGIAPDGKLLFRPDRGALRRLAHGEVEAVRP